MNEREISMCLKLSIFMQGKVDHYTANLVIVALVIYLCRNINTVQACCMLHCVSSALYMSNQYYMALQFACK